MSYYLFSLKLYKNHLSQLNFLHFGTCVVKSHTDASVTDAESIKSLNYIKENNFFFIYMKKKFDLNPIEPTQG